jgi:hypothetical protein
MFVSVVMLTALLLVSRLRGSTRGESDSDVASGSPFSLLLVHFLCHDCDDVALCVGVHEINAEPLSDRDVRRRTVTV